MHFKRTLVATAFTVMTAAAANAGCSYENKVELKSLTAGFEAWKAVTSAMAECGNFQAELDQEFREKQPAAFAANPALYEIGGVANGTVTPLMNQGTIRPLDDLVEKYGANLTPNQIIKIDGQTMAIAMMVNTQHLMYRQDIFDELGLAVPETYPEMLEAAARIREAGLVEYPIGGTFKTGWNLGQEFVNMYGGFGGTFVDDRNNATINNEAGVKTLEMLKAMTEYMDPEYLVSDSTYVQQQFQQGKIAMANLWASRAAAMNDPTESTVVGKVIMATAPSAEAGGPPATTLWWDGIVIARNISDEAADAAFRLVMEGLDEEMVRGANDAAVWLVNGYQPGPLAEGAFATARKGPASYPSAAWMGAMHTALGDNVADFLTGAKDAVATLESIESAYTTAAREAGLIQ